MMSNEEERKLKFISIQLIVKKKLYLSSVSIYISLEVNQNNFVSRPHREEKCLTSYKCNINKEPPKYKQNNYIFQVYLC